MISKYLIKYNNKQAILHFFKDDDDVESLLDDKEQIECIIKIDFKNEKINKPFDMVFDKNHFVGYITKPIPPGYISYFEFIKFSKDDTLTNLRISIALNISLILGTLLDVYHLPIRLFKEDMFYIELSTGDVLFDGIECLISSYKHSFCSDDSALSSILQNNIDINNYTSFYNSIFVFLTLFGCYPYTSLDDKLSFIYKDQGDLKDDISLFNKIPVYFKHFIVSSFSSYKNIDSSSWIKFLSLLKNISIFQESFDIKKEESHMSNEIT